MVMNRAHDLAVAGHVDEGGGYVVRQRRDSVVGDDAIVTTEALAKHRVSLRGETDHLVLSAAITVEKEGEAEGGLARSAREHDCPRAEEAVVGEKVVEKERGHEERAEEHLPVLVLRCIAWVAGSEEVLIVDRRQRLPMCRGVDEAAAAG